MRFNVHDLISLALNGAGTTASGVKADGGHGTILICSFS